MEALRPGCGWAPVVSVGLARPFRSDGTLSPAPCASSQFRLQVGKPDLRLPGATGRSRARTHARDVGAPPDLHVRRRRGRFRAAGAGMLSLESGLRLFAALRLPSGSEMPKKAGAASKAKSESRGVQKVGRRSKDESKEPEKPLRPLGPVTVDAKGCVTIAIHAKPGSKQSAVTDLTTEAINVAIAAPPSEGEANAELCRYLSKVLELRKSDVVLDKSLNATITGILSF
ncbi:UPF0235 protein C15orf40 homolog [Octodon degus]|uniref:UPF0235 protein C15orf40 homolog n=1 Tax=Octodon degus TaxID=10160 RepID=A0A6P6E764_OCTDE|nr:UPF0235 protein C15orf40 homolog [Octodon degus]